MISSFKRRATVAFVATFVCTLASAKVIQITKDNSAQMLTKSKEKPLIVDFWADWCQPCKMMTPTFEAVSKKLDKKYTFAKANVDEVREFAEQFGVQSLPTFAVIKDGKVIGSFMGVKQQDEFEAKVDEIFNGVDFSKFTPEQLGKRMVESISTLNFHEIKAIAKTKGFDINAPLMPGAANTLGFAVMFAPQLEEKGLELINLILELGADPESTMIVGGKSYTVIGFMRGMHEAAKKSIEIQKTILSKLQDVVVKKKTAKK